MRQIGAPGRSTCLAWDPAAAFADAARHPAALDAGLDEAQSTLLFFASNPDARQDVALPLRALRRAGSVTVSCAPPQINCSESSWFDSAEAEVFSHHMTPGVARPRLSPRFGVALLSLDPFTSGLTM